MKKKTCLRFINQIEFIRACNHRNKNTANNRERKEQERAKK